MEMTEARGCTRAEATIARAKARQLMEKHGVSLKELMPSTGITSAQAPAGFQQKSSQAHSTAHSFDLFPIISSFAGEIA
jgi:hypothetical protein